MTEVLIGISCAGSLKKGYTQNNTFREGEASCRQESPNRHSGSTYLYSDSETESREGIGYGYRIVSVVCSVEKRDEKPFIGKSEIPPLVGVDRQVLYLFEMPFLETRTYSEAS